MLSSLEVPISVDSVCLPSLSDLSRDEFISDDLLSVPRLSDDLPVPAAPQPGHSHTQ